MSFVADIPDGEVDENTDGQDENKEEVIPPPEIKHYLTGITVSADKANAAPISFIYGANDPLYGISSALMTVEIPTENGETRKVGSDRERTSCECNVLVYLQADSVLEVV